MRRHFTRHPRQFYRQRQLRQRLRLFRCTHNEANCIDAGGVIAPEKKVRDRSAAAGRQRDGRAGAQIGGQRLLLKIRIERHHQRCFADD